jgi:DNA-binding MarR family transcriptional regulator
MMNRTFALLERISALLRSEQRREAGSAGLEPVHLQALGYLARANRFSDTPQSVGEYLGLSKGNMSQRLLWLERSGYLKRTKDERDGRVVHLGLTGRGLKAVAEFSPPALWVEAGGEDENLASELEGVLHRLLGKGGYRGFGQCRTCRHHEKRAGGGHCGLLKVDLELDQIDKLCREHEMAEEAERIRTPDR